jgi:hypothetical protein
MAQVANMGGGVAEPDPMGLKMTIPMVAKFRGIVPRMFARALVHLSCALRF